ncbi:glycosyltransferase family protein [Rhodovulum sulfidophilum]|uniref:hypothetical protein n=1 Tax=Rhodovulum sulfidophilum TaxID=35806 RepID=UPI000B03FD38|nr:hypothetical protein [Rhodovulum sulfidophilum]
MLVDLLDDIGGSPRSLSAQISQLDSSEFAFTITASTLSDQINRLAPPGAKVVCAPRFPSKNLLGIFTTAKAWMKILKSEAPDIIISNRASQFRFLSPIAAKLSIPLLIVIPGGAPRTAQLAATKDRTAIAYSAENVAQLLKSGYPEENVFLCSNRIKLDCSMTTPKPVDNTELNIAVVGNLKQTTHAGVRDCIRFFYENASSSWANVTVHFFGQNLLDPSASDFEKAMAPENLDRPENLRFISHGWVDNIETAVVPMDIAIGKGRSVLTSSMLEKPSFVLSEDNGVIPITTETVRTLQKTNFTGRQFETDFKPLLEMISTKETLLAAQDENTDVARYIKAQYLVEGAGETIKMAINKALEPGNRRGTVSAVPGLLHSYYYAVADFFTRR